MLLAYIIGCVVSAIWVGFETPIKRQKADDLPRLVMVTLSWPFIVLAGFGHALRMFSLRRTAEDEGEPWASRP